MKSYNGDGFLGYGSYILGALDGDGWLRYSDSEGDFIHKVNSPNEREHVETRYDFGEFDENR